MKIERGKNNFNSPSHASAPSTGVARDPDSFVWRPSIPSAMVASPTPPHLTLLGSLGSGGLGGGSSVGSCLLGGSPTVGVCQLGPSLY